MQVRYRPPADPLLEAAGATAEAAVEGRGVGVASKASWGTFLDAGTGAHSLQWVRQLPLQRWSAVTADKGMQATVEKEMSKPVAGAAPGTIVLGNWDDEELLGTETFDVVLADYLIGAMDGFSPFKQDLIFERLKRHLDPATGILYIISLEPIPYAAPHPEDVIVEMTRVRDACILMAGHRCYREHPRTWVERQLVDHGFKVLGAEQLPILYSAHAITRQLNVARSKLPMFKDRRLAEAMKQHIDELERRAANTVAQQGSKRIKHGFDYIIAAEIDSNWRPHSISPPAAECTP